MPPVRVGFERPGERVADGIRVARRKWRKGEELGHGAILIGPAGGSGVLVTGAGLSDGGLKDEGAYGTSGGGAA